MSASGPDVTRSGAGRLAGELLLLPSAALSPAVTWEPVDDDRARARVEAGGMTHTLTVTVGATGMLTAVTLPRWGNPGNSPFREHTFGAEFHAERRFEGFTLPSEVRAGWGYGTDRWSKGEFIRYTLDKAAFI